MISPRDRLDDMSPDLGDSDVCCDDTSRADDDKESRPVVGEATVDGWGEPAAEDSSGRIDWPTEVVSKDTRTLVAEDTPRLVTGNPVELVAGDPVELTVNDFAELVMEGSTAPLVCWSSVEVLGEETMAMLLSIPVVDVLGNNRVVFVVLSRGDDTVVVPL